MAMATVAKALELGVEHHRRGELAQAESIYRQVLAREPQNIQALNLLASLALQSSRFDEGIALLQRAVGIAPGVVELRCNLGAAHLQARQYGQALRVLNEAIRRHPKAVSPIYNRALVLQEMDRFDESAAAFRRCLELEPNHVVALNNLGNILGKRGKPDEGLRYLDRALALRPNFALAHYNRSLALLSLGRLKEGFAESEWWLQSNADKWRKLPQPTWDGSPLSGQTLLVHAEQGLGDTLQYVRYLALVQQRVGHVLFGTSKSALPLLRQSGYRNLVLRDEPLPPFDFQVPLPSLPYLFGTTLETIPADVPYLTASPRLIELWQARLSAYDGFKVGIVWQGNKSFGDDRFRSFPLTCFAPLAAIGGVRLFSLQKGDGSEQIGELGGAFEVIEFGDQVDNESGTFMDTAAIMKNLDLVICSDTSSAHLAGALGVKLWIALAHVPDCRWMQNRDDSPWYPSARLFRQPDFGDWAAVFQAMAKELRQLMDAV